MRKLATVRRFNFGNGHGFVKTDAGDADVFLFTPDQLRANGRRGGLAYVATILSNSGGHMLVGQQHWRAGVESEGNKNSQVFSVPALSLGLGRLLLFRCACTVCAVEVNI
jgi:hypothetical protein